MREIFVVTSQRLCDFAHNYELHTVLEFIKHHQPSSNWRRASRHGYSLRASERFGTQLRTRGHQHQSSNPPGIDEIHKQP
ncbi:uncharacterized protein K489DRAFT_54879 [Dissoconium aciculare CBS 342.82]|uniref:Uncharacterized protein n=1 Tax=Dissoconium aciculare CBS 342.82 TaxID=1314786 RepID=A0A6J3LXA3_9PEZI|nr:uncharacterized protein K489DRAFT_54879 [Dissoconium aciculare CBS 342.82]KAF1820381.1 hypothetical protein K489DRAFT_54879 [Dissoconium aciculare CBS 342.82]